MKNPFRDKVRGGGYSCIVIMACALIFSSCENFLKGGEVAQEIKDTIAYNNAPSSTLVLNAPAETGSFLSGSEKSCKLGYTIEVQFSVNQASYVYRGMEAVSKSNPSKSLADYIQFTDLSTDSEKQNGTYKVQIKLLKQSDDIMIRPLCLLIPKVESVTPAFTPSGYDQDSIIKITFNKAVDPQSFGTYECLSIYCDSGDLKTYFDAPYFSIDNTVLNIPPKQDTHILTPDSGQKLDVSVNLDYTNLKDKDGLSITKANAHTYRINDSFGNQQTATIMVRTVEGTGRFVSDEKKICTVGYGFELQFEVNASDYKFTGLQALSKDGKESRSDYVTFEETSTDEEHGLYTIFVRAEQPGDDIVIQPVCYAYPAVTDYSPVSKTASFANVPIVITFSTQIPVEQFKNNIFLNFNGIDRSDTLFEEPVIKEVQINGETKTQLSIKPKALALRDFILVDQKASIIDINVLLSSKISINKEGFILPLKQDSNTSFTIRYSKDIEDVPPQENEFFVSAYEIKLEEAESFSKGKFALGNFQLDTNADKVRQNKCGNSVWIYGRYYDGGSGVKSVTVTDQRTNKRTGLAVVDETEYEMTYMACSDNAKFISDDAGNTVFCIKHDIRSEEGAVKMQVIVKDACDNPSENNTDTIKTFTAIKISSIATSVSISNKPDDNSTLEDFLNNFNKLNIYVNDNRYYGTIRGDNFTEISCEYLDNDGLIKNEKFSKVENKPGYYVLDWGIEDITGHAFQVICIDEFGNEAIFEKAFPDFSSPRSVELMTSGQHEGEYKVTVDTINLIYELDSNNMISNVSRYYDPPVYNYYLSPDSNYYFCSYSTANNGHFAYSKPILFKTTELEKSQKVNITDISYTKSDIPNKVNVTITIADNSWKQFDRIYVDYDTENGYSFQKGLYTLTISDTLNKLTHTIYGTKRLQYPDPLVITLDYDCSEYDNNPPKLEIQDRTYDSSIEDADYVRFKMEDDYNEVDYSEIYVGDYCDYIDSDTGFEVRIPIWIFEENSYSVNKTPGITYYSCTENTKYSYISKDTAGNFGKQTNGITIFSLINFKPDDYSGGTSCKLKTQKVSKNSNMGTAYVYISKLLTTASESQERYNDWAQVDSAQRKTVSFNDSCYNISGVTLPENSFVKILVWKREIGVYQYYFSDAQYIYTGTTRNSGTYDFILPNGSSKTSIVVSSDAPTFVHTLATYKPYSECKDWTVEEWEHHHSHFGDKYIDFDGDLRAQKYDIPMNIIKNEGWNCYVVIAHFADGTTAMSEVMQK